MTGQSWLTEGLFWVHWFLIPAIILHYRITSVAQRYDEVRDAFLWRGLRPEQDLCEPERLPAWHYLKKLRPFEATNATRLPARSISYSLLIEPIDEQFRILHGWKNYAIPLGLVFLFAGADLLTCHTLVTGSVKASDPVKAAFAGAYVWSFTRSSAGGYLAI